LILNLAPSGVFLTEICNIGASAVSKAFLINLVNSYRFYADCSNNCWVGADVLALNVHWLTTVVPTALKQQFAILDARVW
jgi:hypothetical protein